MSQLGVFQSSYFPSTWREYNPVATVQGTEQQGVLEEYSRQNLQILLAL